MSDSSNKAKSIFLEAIEKHTPEQWPMFLDKACGDDGALRDRVAHLLRARSALGSFHESAEATVDQPMRDGPGTIIGRYKLLQQIGEGGMGTVYMAEQTQSVQRKVALKIIKPGMDSAQVIARFEAERQALAMMDHVNIARVLDVGATEAGRPYFVMELVHGVSITKYCDDSRLTPRQRLELFVPICQAIHHAHQKGIIHRDIKPSNVMITLCDGRPVPKVIDFGVAKATEQRLTEHTLFTQYGAMVGTPEYMSPEQAEMSALGVDTRSDIYSLGVLLYELLTGSTPLIHKRVREAGLSEIQRMIKEEEPPTPSHRLSDSGDALALISARRQTEPSKLAILLRGEVDWIVMKCLEKDRTRRYESAASLALEIQRYLAGDPLEETVPPSAMYRLRKFARKHKAGLFVGGAFFLLLVVGMMVSTWQAVRATQAERQIKEERNRAQMALTQQVADRIDGEMKQLAAVANTIEAALAHREDWERAHLVHWLTDLVRKDDRIHGITLAYKPWEGPDKGMGHPKGYYCLYVVRSEKSPTGIKDVDLFPSDGPVKDPAKHYDLYTEWPWYKDGLKGPHWNGPGYDGAPQEQFWMFSYSIPMSRKQKIVGVLTVDLRMKYFKQDWLKDLNLGGKGYGFLVNGLGVSDGTGTDRTGAFVSHFKFGAGADKEQPPKVITKLEGAEPAFNELADRILKTEKGRGDAVDPATKNRSTFLFARVPSTRWTFVAVIEE